MVYKGMVVIMFQYLAINIKDSLKKDQILERFWIFPHHNEQELG